MGSNLILRTTEQPEEGRDFIVFIFYLENSINPGYKPQGKGRGSNKRLPLTFEANFKR